MAGSYIQNGVESMKDYMIRTNSCWYSFTMVETKGDSSVGGIAKFDEVTGVMTVLTTLD